MVKGTKEDEPPGHRWEEDSSEEGVGGAGGRTGSVSSLSLHKTTLAKQLYSCLTNSCKTIVQL